MTEARAASDQAVYTPEQIKEMPRFSGIENRRCPKSRYRSVKKHLILADGGRMLMH
tara:strand:+ start:155 stop:322 length:168 start_codon:yes stop_codon:yes gene_type:complete